MGWSRVGVGSGSVAEQRCRWCPRNLGRDQLLPEHCRVDISSNRWCARAVIGDFGRDSMVSGHGREFWFRHFVEHLVCIGCVRGFGSRLEFTRAWPRTCRWCPRMIRSVPMDLGSGSWVPDPGRWIGLRNGLCSWAGSDFLYFYCFYSKLINFN